MKTRIEVINAYLKRKKIVNDAEARSLEAALYFFVNSQETCPVYPPSFYKSAKDLLAKGRLDHAIQDAGQ